MHVRTSGKICTRERKNARNVSLLAGLLLTDVVCPACNQIKHTFPTRAQRKSPNSWRDSLHNLVLCFLHPTPSTLNPQHPHHVASEIIFLLVDLLLIHLLCNASSSPSSPSSSSSLCPSCCPVVSNNDYEHEYGRSLPVLLHSKVFGRYLQRAKLFAGLQGESQHHLAVRVRLQMHLGGVRVRLQVCGGVCALPGRVLRVDAHLLQVRSGSGHWNWCRFFRVWG